MKPYIIKQDKPLKINFFVTIFILLVIMLLMNVHLLSQENGVLASNLGNSLVMETPTEFKVYQNFPNPCFNLTAIKFDIASQTDAVLKIFDSNGNEMKTYLYNNIKPGMYQITVDASTWEQGIYTYKFTSGNYSESYFMNVLK